MTAHNGNVSLAFEQVGDDGGEPLLLIMGLGMQMIYWPDGLLAEFAEAGFTVARFDNRDAGASTHLTWLGTPSLPVMLAAPRLVGAVPDLRHGGRHRRGAGCARAGTPPTCWARRSAG